MTDNVSSSALSPTVLVATDVNGVFSNLQVGNIKTIFVKREQLLQAIHQFSPDVVLIETESVGDNEVLLIKSIRGISGIPVVVMSKEYNEEGICRAFREGMDDCMIKPVGINEVIARIEAVLRRNRPSRPPESAIEKIDDYLSVDHNRNLVVTGGKEKKLTPTEYRLLSVLLKNRGYVLTKHELLLRAFGDGYETAMAELRWYIYCLRQKIEPNPSRPRYILTDPHRGYYFAQERVCPNSSGLAAL